MVVQACPLALIPCRIIRETGHRPTSNNTDIVPNLVITCKFVMCEVLSQNASMLVRVGLRYLNYYCSFSTTNVGYNTPLTWDPISGSHVRDPHIDNHVEPRGLTLHTGPQNPPSSRGARGPTHHVGVQYMPTWVTRGRSTTSTTMWSQGDSPYTQGHRNQPSSPGAKRTHPSRGCTMHTNSLALIPC